MADEISSFLTDIPVIGGALHDAVAVPLDLFSGNFSAIPGDLATNAIAGATNAIAPGGGSFLQTLGSSALNAGLNAGAQSLFGSGQSAGGGKSSPKEPTFKPSQQAAMGLPQSLSQFSSLSPDQLTSNIATQGVYGGGNGPEENKYFLNLINRQLVDQSGKTGDMGQLSGIDNSYLSQLGLGGMSNTKDLLKGISNYQFS